MKNYFIFSLPFVALLSTPGFAGAKAFKHLQAKSSPVFECEFDFKSARTQEHFVGRVKLTSTGEFHMVAARNEETPNECELGLETADTGALSESGDLFFSGTRIDACVPALSADMRSRLNENVQIWMNRYNLKKSAGDRTATIAAVYLEGIRKCKVVALNPRGIGDLAQRLQAGTLQRKKRSIATERLDISKERQRLKKRAKPGDTP